MLLPRVIVGLTASLALLSGCSAAATTTTTAAPAGTAASPAAPAGTALTPDAFVEKVTTAMQSVTSYTLDMTTTTGGKKTTMQGVVKADAGRTTAMHITMGGETATELIMIDGKFFMKAPTGWVKMPESATQSMDLSQTDQTQWMRDNKGAIAKVELVGSEAINGVQADHYRIDLDLSKVAGASASAAKITNYETWLDSEGRMVKMLMSTEVSGTSTELEMLVSKYNEPVEITAPADYTEMPG
ncbi:MAG: LppX_LprAFG lipoprotein [Micropruina sp.]|nr:LppX_LprAFG lipoprotein [Micropruina sp.]